MLTNFFRPSNLLSDVNSFSEWNLVPAHDFGGCVSFMCVCLGHVYIKRVLVDIVRKSPLCHELPLSITSYRIHAAFNSVFQYSVLNSVVFPRKWKLDAVGQVCLGFQANFLQCKAESQHDLTCVHLCLLFIFRLRQFLNLLHLFHSCLTSILAVLVRWYTDKFLKGQWDKEECQVEWEAYRACLSKRLEDRNLSHLLRIEPAMHASSRKG